MRFNRIGFKEVLVYILLILILAVVAFISFSKTFERDTPIVKFEEEIEGKEIFWNVKTPLKLMVSDESGIKSFKASFSDGQNSYELQSQAELLDSKKGIYSVVLTAPKEANMTKSTAGTINIEAIDNSKWHFFKGNKLRKATDVIVDKRSPKVDVLSNSYMLKQGGSGILIVKIDDENIKDFYVNFNDEETFELFPFYKKNYYISIITWPIDIKEFKGVNVIALDKAGNKTVTKVPYYIQSFKPKIDNLKISDEFVYNVSQNVLELSGMEVPDRPQDIFVKANKDLRAENLQTMREITRKNMINNNVPFEVKTFTRLKNAATFAMFGERRHYFYNDEKIDEAWHLGMDWASVKRADISVSNPGLVIYKDYLGIYGESLIVDHGYGLASLYAHTSSQSVEVGDFVQKGQNIANTGATGAVFGDHLHFGILVQGIEANPNEWLDANWMKLNLTNTINSAIKIIDGNKK